MLSNHGGLSGQAARWLALALLLGWGASSVEAQKTAGPTSRSGAASANAATPNTPAQASEADVASTREQLMDLLRMSPKLMAFVARDPSLLGDQDYVARNNPELAKFLEKHPEVAHNTEFYLFAEVGKEGNRTRFAREDWQRERYEPTAMHELSNTVGPFLIFVILLGSLLWLLRTLLENRRWGRIFKLQTEVHNKLLDKCGSSEEMMAYMRTDAGKRFLEAAPISVSFVPGSKQLGSAVARILTPLQLGVVLVLLGAGFYSLRGQVSGGDEVLVVLGMLTLMLGLGFIISAGISWVLAWHLGLLPKRGTQPGNGNGHDPAGIQP